MINSFNLTFSYRDNYGFVTFAYKVDAYEAVEHGNDDPHLPKYDLSFGGRRAFCKETYADLGDHKLTFCVISRYFTMKIHLQMRLTMTAVPRPMTLILIHC